MFQYLPFIRGGFGRLGVQVQESRNAHTHLTSFCQDPEHGCDGSISLSALMEQIGLSEIDLA